MLTFAQAAVSLSIAAATAGVAPASPAAAGIAPIAPPTAQHAPLLLAEKPSKPQGSTLPARAGHNPPPTNAKPHAPTQATGATPTSGNATSATSSKKK